MTISRFDIRPIGEAAGNLYRLRAEQDRDYWKERYDDLARILHAIVDAADKECDVRLVCGSIDVTVSMKKLP